MNSQSHNQYTFNHVKHFILYLEKIGVLPTEYILLSDLHNGEDHQFFKSLFNKHEKKSHVIDLKLITVSMVRSLIYRKLIKDPSNRVITKLNNELLSKVYHELELTEIGKKIVLGLYEKENRDEIIKTYELKQEEIQKDIEKDTVLWLGEYIDKWHPRNIGITGKDLDPKRIEVKLIKFQKENPIYNKQIILEASTLYIKDSLDNKELNPKYLMNASNFIEFDNKSKLKEYCQYIADGYSLEAKYNTTVL